VRFRRSLLWLNVCIFLVFGLGYLVAPNYLGSFVDMQLSAPNALIDMRALYGGMLVGISIWYLYCAMDEARIHQGLLSAMFIASGLLSGRLIGVLVSGSPNGATIFYVLTEVLVVLLLAVALRRDPRAPGAIMSGSPSRR